MRVGDTITSADNPASEPLAGFKELKPMVFAGLYPTESNQYGALREAIEKLRLNDASLIFEPETSQALGFGFRAGFLGLLHMEIAQERLEREFGLNLVDHGADRRLPRTHAGRRGPDGGQSVARCPTSRRSRRSRSRSSWLRSTCREEYLGAVMKSVRGAARHAARPALSRSGSA